MDPDAHSTVTTPHILRQSQRSRSTSGNRSCSSSSHSSTHPSRPATPSDTVYTHLHPQFRHRPTNSPYSPSIDESFRQKSHTEPQSHLSPPSSSRSSLEETHLQPDDYRHFLKRRPRTQTVTPTSVRRALQSDSGRMQTPFPMSNQRDSASSSESRPSCSSSDSASLFEEELGAIPARHTFRNRVDSKPCSHLFNDAERLLISPMRSLRARPHPYRSESSSSVSSGTFSPKRSSSSLRLKPKKSHSHRGAMTLFKSLASSPNPDKHEDIEFDWAEQRRQELEKRAIIVEQIVKGARLAAESTARTEPEIQCSPEGDDVETPSRASMPPGSWELTPEEQALRSDQKREAEKRFIFKDHVWLNRSYVSAHSRNAVPYPFAYDNVNIQTDRHSHALVRQLLCGHPSIHDDPSNKTPAVVLDLGCGDGTWLLEAAQCWKNTRFYGLDLQNLHPSPHQLEAALGELAENIKFTHYNFLLDKLPYLDEKFDLVRMANLKWAIPEDKWDFVLQEVNRVLRRGGRVEIIDDDFLLPTFPQDTLSLEERAACDMLETQFMDMLRARNLLLNTGGQFMAEKLSRWFNAFHEDNFPITISKTRPVSMELPSEGVSLKAAKLMGIEFDSISEKRRSAGSTRPRSRSDSVSSGASYSSGVSWTSGRDAERLDDLSHVSHEQYGLISEIDKHYQPLGLDVHPGHFLPFPPDELNTQCIRNMQSILASKEAIRAHTLKKCSELEELETKEDLPPDARQRFHKLSVEWNHLQRAFDDVFWDYETGMLKRFGLPQRHFDADDDNELHHKSLNIRPRTQPYQTTSVLGKLHKNGDDLQSPFTNTSVSSRVLVRLIRVYSGWK
ncbi:hypothetical protein JB92DRAFT_443680 [Gautieria morchelliformis]|nr:hypothetical protein JB92DRAFT_443680 [Gautieria morchelliformis]